MRHVPKFLSSKEECNKELDRILQLLGSQDKGLARQVSHQSDEAVRRFSEEFDAYTRQILTHLESEFRAQKESTIREIKMRRDEDTVEIRPIRQSILKLRE